MQFQNLPFWAKALLAAILAAVLIFVAFKYPPADLAAKGKKSEELTGQINDLKSEVRIAETAAAKRKELEAEIRRLDRELESLRTHVPEGVEIVWKLRQIVYERV